MPVAGGQSQDISDFLTVELGLAPPWYPLSGDDQRLLRRDHILEKSGRLEANLISLLHCRSCRKFSCVAFMVEAWAAQTPPTPKPASILSYIQQTWAVLTRSNRGLAAAAPDP
jgi:hypothetical protein